MMRIFDLRRLSRTNIIRGIVLAALFGGCFGLIPAANAQTFSSSYTSTAPRDCRVTSAGNGVDDSTIRVCPGKAGLVVVITEDDLREAVSVGRTRAAADKEPAAETSFGPFNSTTHTVEWRARMASRSRLSSAGTSPTLPTKARTAGRSQNRCWR